MHAITPNDLLLGRTWNQVPGPVYDLEESFTRRQHVMRELERSWWDQWIVQALPSLVPYKRWKHEHRSLQIGDIVLVLYDKGIGDYRLGQVTDVRKDSHGVVRTVTVGMRSKDRDKPLPIKLDLWICWKSVCNK